MHMKRIACRSSRWLQGGNSCFCLRNRQGIGIQVPVSGLPLDATQNRTMCLPCRKHAQLKRMVPLLPGGLSVLTVFQRSQSCIRSVSVKISASTSHLSPSTEQPSTPLTLRQSQSTGSGSSPCRIDSTSMNWPSRTLMELRPFILRETRITCHILCLKHAGEKDRLSVCQRDASQH